MKQGVLIANGEVFCGPHGPRNILPVSVVKEVERVDLPQPPHGCTVRIFHRVQDTPELAIFREEGHA